MKSDLTINFLTCFPKLSFFFLKSRTKTKYNKVSDQIFKKKTTEKVIEGK